MEDQGAGLGGEEERAGHADQAVAGASAGGPAARASAGSAAIAGGPAVERPDRPRRSPRAGRSGGSRRSGWRSRVSNSGQQRPELAAQVLVAGRAEDEGPRRAAGSRSARSRPAPRPRRRCAHRRRPARATRPAPRPAPASAAWRTRGRRRRGRPSSPCSARTSRLARATAAFWAWCGPSSGRSSSPQSVRQVRTDDPAGGRAGSGEARVGRSRSGSRRRARAAAQRRCAGHAADRGAGLVAADAADRGPAALEDAGLLGRRSPPGCCRAAACGRTRSCDDRERRAGPRWSSRAGRPGPTSSTTAPTCSRAKWSRPIAVVISKNVGPRCRGCGSLGVELVDRRSDRVDQGDQLVGRRPRGRRCVNRSSSRCRWGEQNRPVRTPEADRAAAIIAEVEPFPLVPATWMIRSADVRVAQPAEQPAHPAQAELGRSPGHAQPLVIEPAVEVVETVLIVVGHGVAWRAGPPVGRCTGSGHGQGEARARRSGRGPARARRRAGRRPAPSSRRATGP